MRLPSIVGALSAIVLAAALGCGPKTYIGSSQAGGAATDPCSVLSYKAANADTITVALFEPIDPLHAPYPTNDSERLVFGVLYEPLLRDDCFTGQGVYPGLVEFKMQGRGHATLTLRDHARFADGSAVTSSDVATSLRRSIAEDTSIDSLVVLDPRTVEIYLSHQQTQWVFLTSAHFALTKLSQSAWPVGTSPYAVTEHRAGCLITEPMFRIEGPVIRFLELAGTDPRDILEGHHEESIDFMIVGDPAVVEYATARADLKTEQLASTTAYVLISTRRVELLGGGVALPMLTDSLCASLASDAVRTADARGLGDVRKVARDCWWEDAWRCKVPGSVSPTTPSSREREVVYNESDPAARDLAERLAALSTRDSREAAAIADAVVGSDQSPAPLTARALSPRHYAAALTRGTSLAYVVALPFRTSNPCHAVEQLLSAAPWLGAKGVSLADALVPLVTTRRFAIAERHDLSNRRTFELLGDYYGGLRIVDSAAEGVQP